LKTSRNRVLIIAFSFALGCWAPPEPFDGALDIAEELSSAGWKIKPETRKKLDQFSIRELLDLNAYLNNKYLPSAFAITPYLASKCEAVMPELTERLRTAQDDNSIADLLRVAIAMRSCKKERLRVYQSALISGAQLIENERLRCDMSLSVDKFFRSITAAAIEERDKTCEKLDF
jgi:hypothetical protein